MLQRIFKKRRVSNVVMREGGGSVIASEEESEVDLLTGDEG